MAAALISLEALSAMDEKTFVETLGSIYENSPWVATAAAKQKPFTSLKQLAGCMAAIVDQAEEEMKLALLRAHPDLAGKAALAGDMTDDSKEEQARAGLSTLTPEELEKFTALNNAYKTKFGWPFIIAVRNATKRAIMMSFERRIGNDSCAERAECIKQVHKIAYMRLLNTVQFAPTGFLTCHVLDTARGCPAAGLQIILRRQIGAPGAGTWETIGTYVTNADGRLPGGPALKGENHKHGVYEWTFFAGEYFTQAGVPTGCTPFLDEVPIRFGIDDPEDHYHVPLLVSPWSCSTYRGS